jgi:hypothetical protein
MDLPEQCLKVAPDIVDDNKALVIELPAAQEALIIWAFTKTIRQNLLALTTVDDSGNPKNYLLARWQDPKVEYRLKNPTADKQWWYITGWEVGWQDPPLDCPGRQDNIKGVPSVHGSSGNFLSTYPQLDDGSGIHPGDILATVKVYL